MIEENRIVNALPSPPAYYKLFTPSALVPSLEKKDESELDLSTLELDSVDSTFQFVTGQLPNPPCIPPPGGSYYTFGQICKVDFQLEYLLPKEQILFEQKGDHRNTKLNFKIEMRKLLDMVMTNYSQLIDVLLKCPSLHAEKVTTLEQLFVNMHNIINHFRPHEARQHLICRLNYQIKEQKNELLELEQALQKSDFLAHGAQEILKTAIMSNNDMSIG